MNHLDMSLDAALVARLEVGLRALEPDALYRRRLRGMVLNRHVAAREGLDRQPHRRREMGGIGRGVLYASVVVAMTAGATGAAAASSLPGDLLYPVKLQLEELRVQVAPPSMRGDMIARTLEERLEELEQLAANGAWAQVPLAARAVEAAEERLAKSKQAPSQAALDAVSHHVVVLEALLSTSPPSAQRGLQQALQAATSPTHPTHLPPANGPKRRDPQGQGGGGENPPDQPKQQPHKPAKPES
jgi:uncharacterized protein DUF5667